MSVSKKNSSESLLALQLGSNGQDFIFGTGANTAKRYQFLVVHEDAVFTTLTDSAGDDLKADTGIAANTIKAGTNIFAFDGKSIAAVTLASGSVIGIL